MMAVDLTGTIAGREFKAGTPHELFTGLRALGPHNYDITPDGKRFLVVTLEGQNAVPSPVVIVLLPLKLKHPNWPKVPVKRL